MCVGILSKFSKFWNGFVCMNAHFPESINRRCSDPNRLSECPPQLAVIQCHNEAREGLLSVLAKPRQYSGSSPTNHRIFILQASNKCWNYLRGCVPSAVENAQGVNTGFPE